MALASIALAALFACGEYEPGEGEPNKAPTVTITSPQNGVTLGEGNPIAITATAADPDGEIVQVEFLVGATSLGNDNSAPFAGQWTPNAAGIYLLTARATDDSGAVTTSGQIAVTISTGGGPDTQAPVVTITSPVDQAQGLTGSIQIVATATDNVGIAGIQFQVDGVDLGLEDVAAPFQATLPATAVYASGQHVIRARARDTTGNLSAWAVAEVEFSDNAALPANFSRTSLVPDLPSLATTMAFAPDGRLFICLQSGAVLVVKNGALLATPFVTVPTTADGERGLLGIAFHPDYASTRWVYLYYTSSQGGPHNRISRFTEAVTGDTAESTESILVDLPNLSGATNHNGGALHFGLDGKLFVAVGDNAAGGNAQSMTTTFGKILRFNNDGSIPADNPFLGSTTGLNRSIWARGLRNPYSFGIQPGTGRMLINDVGQGAWEEINEGVAGANYGWPATEGPTNDPAFQSPVYAYQHNSGLVRGIAIVGSAFYDPTTASFPAEYIGSYFFADFAGGWIYRLIPGAGNSVSAFATMPGQQTDLKVGPDGALYSLAHVGGSWSVQRISFGP